MGCQLEFTECFGEVVEFCSCGLQRQLHQLLDSYAKIDPKIAVGSRSTSFRLAVLLLCSRIQNNGAKVNNTIELIINMRISTTGYVVCFVLIFCSATGEFVEELVLRRASSNALHAQVNFKFSERISDSKTVKFSPVLYSLFNGNHIRQLEFSISQGFWRNTLYGQPPQFGGASGVYVFAEFDSSLTKLVSFHSKRTSYFSVEDQWKTLIQQLNGLFCSSFVVISETLSSSLVFSKAAYTDSRNGSMVYGAFTGDNICTENAESFKKLLPCQRLGLCELLSDSSELYNSLFYSMSFSAWLRSSVWSVHVQTNLLKPIKPNQISVFSIFRRKVTAVCPVATKSLIRIVESPSRVLDLMTLQKDAKIGNPSMNLSNAAFDPNLIEFSSFMRETFLLRGKFISRIKSSAPTTTRAVFLHLLPWQVHVWHSTAQFQCNGQERNAQLRFSPKNSRTAPVLIEMILEIPPKSTCEISYEFQKGFLRFDEYPPDSSSGIHVPGPILNILPGQWSESTIRIHGEPTIVLLPIPDFSMPFNVICFVCTIVALFFQYMLTFTTKYPSTIERESKGLLLWVVHRVKDVYKKFSKKEGNV
ncbi:hypothetical protein M3Y96_00891600 [Aphelenchoides besseyi]|nr:hypothetical protein M3Y96_00891600 [Aphelenchoides besseyi]